jgi:hypothetical protein
MKKIQIILVIMTAVFFMTACGGGSGNQSVAQKSEITVNTDGMEKKFEPTSTWAYHSTKTFTANSETSTASITTVVLANFELDTQQAFISLGKQKLDKPEQIKVMFSFTGEKDTKVETPIKAGEYTAEADKFRKVEPPTIYYVADGKEKSVEFDRNTMKGQLTISGVSGTTITGSIDVTDGKNSLKATFSANGQKSVK